MDKQSGDLLFWADGVLRGPYRRKNRKNRPRIWGWGVLEPWITERRGSAGGKGGQHEHEMVFTPGPDLGRYPTVPGISPQRVMSDLFDQVLSRSFLESRSELLCILVVGNFAMFLSPMAFQGKSMCQESYQVSEGCSHPGKWDLGKLRHDSLRLFGGCKQSWSGTIGLFQ
jgi:hypothetical protein